MKNFMISILFVISFLHADIEVIISSACKVETLSQHEIKNIFMLKRKMIEDQSITILESSDKETYTHFIKLYLKKSRRKMKVYWTRMLFTGKKIPPQKVSSKELKLLDGCTRCYISYLPIEKKPEDWNILTIK